MITRLKLKDFQPHADLDIQLGQVTTIVGPSDRGKSSIIRAISWVMRNQPQGIQHIRHGTKEARVRMEVDGHLVQRMRSKSKNTYSVPGKTYAAPGKDVPECLADIFNVNDHNFQGQHDASYWFHLTPGQVAAQLNTIVNLQVIDDVLGSIKKRYHRARHTVEIAEERLVTAQETAVALDPIIAPANALKRVQVVAAKAAACTDAADIVEKQLNLIRVAFAARDRLSIAATALTGVTTAMRDAGTVNTKTGRLSGVVDQIHGLMGDVPELDHVDESYNRMMVACDMAGALSNQVRSLQARYTASATFTQQASDLQDKLTEEMDGQCPVCGQVL